MMTKTQFANMIVDRFCVENGIDRNSVVSWGEYAYRSSRLAVALEFLGMLTEKQKKYSNNRGGTEFVWYENKGDIDTPVLSTREILEMLPDDIENSKCNKVTIDVENVSLTEMIDKIDAIVNTAGTFVESYVLSVGGVKRLSINIDFEHEEINIDPCAII